MAGKHCGSSQSLVESRHLPMCPLCFICKCATEVKHQFRVLTPEIASSRLTFKVRKGHKGFGTQSHNAY